MNSTNKPMLVASLPDNWSAFNRHEVLPRDISRAEAAATLRRARSLRARGRAGDCQHGGRWALSPVNLQHPRRWLWHALLAPLARWLPAIRYRSHRILASNPREAKVSGRQAVVGDRVLYLGNDLRHFLLAQCIGLRLQRSHLRVQCGKGRSAPS